MQGSLLGPVPGSSESAAGVPYAACSGPAASAEDAPEDLVGEDPDLAQGLSELGLGAEFASAVQELAQTRSDREEALCAAAQLNLCLASSAQAAQASKSLCDSLPCIDAAGQSTRQQLAKEAYLDRVATRPKSTSAAYRGGQKHFEGWCTANNRSTTLTDETSELYARFVCKDERLGPAPGRGTSFKYCCGRILSLRDLRLRQISEGRYTDKQVTNPWSLTTVSLFMKTKYAQENEVLNDGVLSSYLKKRMSHEQLCEALRLCLEHTSREWALLLRFPILWMCSSARRSSDTRNLTYRALCMEDTRAARMDDPWVGVGPTVSRALAFVAAEGKSLPAGFCEASGAIRFRDFTVCPVSAFADLCVLELGNPARLRVEHLAKAFVLRAPSALGHHIMAASSFTRHLGVVLRAAGVPCDLTERGASGKPTVSHTCKRYAIHHAQLVGVDYDRIQHLASHQRDVTKLHYMTLSTDAMHRMAGFGPDYMHSHDLGRLVQVPDGLAALVMPGLAPLAASLAASHPDHPPLAALEALQWLLDVFLQDMPLKLLAHGQLWARLFHREVAALLALPAWWPWAQKVVEGDIMSKNRALANMQFKGDPTTAITQIFRACQQQACGDTLSPSIPQAADLLSERERKGLLRFGLAGLETVEQSIALFKLVEAVPIKRWAGDRKERTKFCTAFGGFRDGLFREYLQLQQSVGEVAAISMLEHERLQLKRTGNHSPLQKLCNHYRKKHKLAPAV